MWDYGPMGVWAERLSDGAWSDPFCQQRKLWVCKETHKLTCGKRYGMVQTSHSCFQHIFGFRWKAANYSQFYGMSLDEGIRYRLGTQRPSRTIMNMNEIQVQDRLPPWKEIVLGVYRIQRSKQNMCVVEIPEGTATNISLDPHILCSSALQQVVESLPSPVLLFCGWPLASDLWPLTLLLKGSKRVEISCYLLLMA